MLNQVDFPLTNSQISEFILDEGYTTYFKLQQALSELLESGFIREESTHHRTFYHLTEEGAETIHYFTNDISPAIQHDIDDFLKEKHYELKNEMSVKADYFENSNMEYSVRCQVIEQGLPLIDLTVTAPTETESGDLCVGDGEALIIRFHEEETLRAWKFTKNKIKLRELTPFGVQTTRNFILT